MIYYLIFSYLVLLGVSSENEETLNWTFILAPVFLPILIGQYLANRYNSEQNGTNTNKLVKKEKEVREIETKKLFDITLEAMNLGMEIRQNQLSGNSEKSGKEYHKEWFHNLKTKYD